VSSDFLKSQRTTVRYPTDFLIGDLLVKAGVIRANQLEEAVRLAGNKKINLGQMLVIARHLTNRDLQAAVDAQSTIRDRKVDMNTAVRALKTACRAGISFSDALKDNGQVQQVSDGPTNKLGELLLEANVIDRDQFGKAMQRSMSTGLPLGRILVLNGAINEPLLTAALEIQVRVRDEMMTREEALGYLRSSGNKSGEEGISVEQAFQIQSALKSPRGKAIRLGELLVLAGMLHDSDVINALELALSNDLQIGQVIVNQGFITPELLDATLKLQELVDKGLMDGEQAAESLKEIQSNALSINDVVEYVEANQGLPTEINFAGLLTLSRVVSVDDIVNAFETARNDPEIVASILCMTGYMNEAAAGAALRCFSLIGSNHLNQDDAMVALDFCLQKQAEGETTFDDALQELGWVIDEPMLAGESRQVDFVAEFAQVPESELQSQELVIEETLTLEALLPESEMLMSEPEMVMPEAAMAMPEPETVMPEADSLTPELEAATPAPKVAMPVAKAVTPVPKAVTPVPKAVTPEPKAVTPEPIAVTPEPIAAAPQHQAEPIAEVVAPAVEATASPETSFEPVEESVESLFDDAAVPAASELVAAKDAETTFDPDSIEASDTSDNLPAIGGKTRGHLNETVSKPFEEAALTEESVAALSSLKEEVVAEPLFDQEAIRGFTRTGTRLDAMDPSDDWLAPVDTEQLQSVAEESLQEAKLDVPEEILVEASEEILVQMDENGNISGILLEQALSDQVFDTTDSSIIESADNKEATQDDQKSSILARRDSAEGLRSLTRSKPQTAHVNGKAQGESTGEEPPVTAPPALIEPEAPILASEEISAVSDPISVGSEPDQNGAGLSEAVGEQSSRPERKERSAQKAGSGNKNMTLKNLLESYAAQSGDQEVIEPVAEEPEVIAAAVLLPAPTGNGHATHAAEKTSKAAKSEEQLVLSANDQAILAAASSLTATPEQIKEAALLLAAHQKADIVAKSTNAAVGAPKIPVEAVAGTANRALAAAATTPAKTASATTSFDGRAGSTGSVRGAQAAEKPTAELPIDPAAEVSMGGLKAVQSDQPENKNGTDESSDSTGMASDSDGLRAKEEEVNAALGDAFVRLAESYYEQGNYPEAEKLYGRILNLREKEEGLKSPTLLSALNNLAGVLCVQGKFEDAEVYVQRCVNILETHEPDNILKLADGLNTLAGIYYQEDKFEQCEPLLERALRLRQRALGEDHPDIADNLRDYAKFLKKVGRAEEAEKMYAQAKAILSQALKKATH
jgi:hypothetical protein